MNLKQLQYFTVLAETLNFHRAAERLNISQPPLTVAIRKLEEDLGVALFVRHSRGASLTEAGQAALTSARAVIAQVDSVREAVRQGATGLRGRLVIGFVGSAVSELLPRIVTRFRADYPMVDLVLEEMKSVEILQAIAAQTVHVGFVRLPVMDATQVAIDVIERDTLVVALPAPLAAQDSGAIQLAELSEHSFILYKPVSILHATVRLACQRAGFTPRVTQEAMQVQTILSLVQAGLGVALVPARTVRFVPEGVKLLPLADPIQIEMGIARAEDAGVLAQNMVVSALAARDTQSVSETDK